MHTHDGIRAESTRIPNAYIRNATTRYVTSRHVTPRSALAKYASWRLVSDARDRNAMMALRARWSA